MPRDFVAVSSLTVRTITEDTVVVVATRKEETDCQSPKNYPHLLEDCLFHTTILPGYWNRRSDTLALLVRLPDNPLLLLT